MKDGVVRDPDPRPEDRRHRLRCVAGANPAAPVTGVARRLPGRELRHRTVRPTPLLGVVEARLLDETMRPIHVPGDPTPIVLSR